ncbi:MAG TPA: GlsB/YeaQ/YmgE family stress response membrane protein [Candidatus Saccharimonadales bacterium]|nr:GlsB/YeaQ/YmgE family stress response membrane protein [Candidatus Saccharimonadales bacterium]
MSLIIFLVFGALVGWIASIVVKNNSRQGLFGDILLGILGSIAGGYIMQNFGQPGVTGFNLYSVFVAVLGAIVLVVLGRMILTMIA